jgi:hypothetical protein
MRDNAQFFPAFAFKVFKKCYYEEEKIKTRRILYCLHREKVKGKKVEKCAKNGKFKNLGKTFMNIILGSTVFSLSANFDRKCAKTETFCKK